MAIEVKPRSTSPEDIQDAHLAEKLLNHWDSATVSIETKYGTELVPLSEVLRIAALLDPNEEDTPETTHGGWYD